MNTGIAEVAEPKKQGEILVASGLTAASETYVTPDSAATIATREQLVQVRCLTAVVDELLENANPLPSDPTMLPVAIAAVLNADERDHWSAVEQQGRERILERSLRRQISSTERRLAQLQRQDLCAHYIDALCRLSENRRSEVGDEAYEILRTEFFASKAAWEKARGRTKRPVSRARQTKDDSNSGTITDTFI